MILNNAHALSSVVTYDGETGEVVIFVDRVTIAVSLEEFEVLCEEMQEARNELKNVLMTKVQYIDDVEVN